MELWRCPHCGIPQAETARCWVCRRSTTVCSTCRHYRRAVAGTLGFCGLDRRRMPQVVIEVLRKHERPSILDIGSGSGNISIALAKNIPACKVVGLDISEEAIKTAKRNAKLNEVDNQLMLVRQNILNGLEIGENKFDVVVSNPPYISAEEYLNLDPELKLYEPRFALTDESDGLSFYRKISVVSKSLLKDDGKLFFEVGAGHAEAVKQILIDNGYKNIVVKKDYSDIERIVIGEKI